MSESHGITLLPLPGSKGRPIVAWLFIGAAIGFLFWRNDSADPQERERNDLLAARMQARYLIGLARLDELLPTAKPLPKETLLKDAQSLDRGPYAQRLRFVVLVGELMGPTEARTHLHRLDQRYRDRQGEPSVDDGRTAEILDRLYAQRERNPQTSVTLPEGERDYLRQRLGWFGDLARTPPGDGDRAARQAVLAPAYRTAFALIFAAFFLLGLALFGLVMAVMLGVFWFQHRLTGGLTVGKTHGGIYAETFAVYLALFLGLSLAGRFLIEWLQWQQGILVLSGLAALGSLSALAWPVCRGIPWRQVRLDIGWIRGRRPGYEALFGLGSYAAALPMLAIALVFTLLLMKLRDRLGWGPDEFGPSDNPGHPIALWAARADWWIWLEILFLASVVAPVVEETMFRGVLYRSLREATRRFRPTFSVLASALVVSFVFAVIHPQGLLGIPALMTLAFAFALMREWQVTLLPAIAAHSINNAVATGLLFLMLG